MKTTINDFSKYSPNARHSNVCSNRFGSLDMSNETNTKTDSVLKKKRVHTQPIGLIFKIYALSAFNNLITLLVNQDQTCRLAMGCKEIIVAPGTILECSKPNVLVVINMVLAPVANLSIQTSELFYVNDGLKQYILWS